MTLPASLASAPQTARAFLPRPAGRRKVLTARPCAYLKAHVDESVKHTVEQAIAALNKHDPIALCGVLSEKARAIPGVSDAVYTAGLELAGGSSRSGWQKWRRLRQLAGGGSRQTSSATP